MSIEDQLIDHEKRMVNLEGEFKYMQKCVDDVTAEIKTLTKPESEGGLIATLDSKVTRLMASGDTLVTLVKYVILPLIVILGGLIGIKLAWPTT